MTTAAAVRENDAAVRRQQRRREHRQLEPTHSASRCVDVVVKGTGPVSRTPALMGTPCGLRGCKNGPAPFRGQMSYKATKPSLVSVLYLSIFFNCVGVY